MYEVNWSFDVLENGGGALVMCGIVVVVPLNVLGLHGSGLKKKKKRGVLLFEG